MLAGREKRLQFCIFITALKNLQEFLLQGKIIEAKASNLCHSHHIEENEQEARVRHHNNSRVGGIEQPPK
jgi:hypothetical protein